MTTWSWTHTESNPRRSASLATARHPSTPGSAPKSPKFPTVTPNSTAPTVRGQWTRHPHRRAHVVGAHALLTGTTLLFGMPLKRRGPVPDTAFGHAETTHPRGWVQSNQGRRRALPGVQPRPLGALALVPGRPDHRDPLAHWTSTS